MPKPSPAFVLSVLALFVALGGTGYAAIQIPKASVGAKQLKAKAVTSGKVRNGALRLRHFKVSERTKLRGEAGARGVSGLTGPAGTPRSAGSRGSAGRRRGLRGTRGFRETGGPGTSGTKDSGRPRASRGTPGSTGVEQVVVRTTAFTFVAGIGATGSTVG